jgi:hypothetical protein
MIWIIQPAGAILVRMFRVTMGVALLFAASLSLANPQTAIKTLAGLQQSLVRDKGQQDWQAYLADARRLKTFLNGSPDGTLELSRAYLQVADTSKALVEAQAFVAMGQVQPLLESEQFQPLYVSLAAQLQRNQSETSLGQQVFVLRDPGLLPEDIDYDSRTKLFFITSILEQKIVALDRHGTLHDFAAAPDRWSMLALKVDALRRRLWATEVALPGFGAKPANEPPRSTLLEYDLDRGTLLTRIEGPAGSALGDMVLTPQGTPIVSDGEGGGIYQLRGQQLQRIDQGDFVSPQTIALCAPDPTLYVPDYVRGLARLDPATGKVTWIASGDRYALTGSDGLYCKDRILIAIQNGTAPERVVAFTLDEARSTVVEERPIERNTPTLGDPTHGVFVGDEFYYIANSGWDVLDEHGNVKAGLKLTAASVMRVPLRSIH